MSLSIWLLDHWCEHCKRGDEVTALNYTHNVIPMWENAGVYDALYNSEWKRAGETLEALQLGVKAMRENLAEFRKLNPPNGWGDADSALAWLIEWTTACERHPDARIGVHA